MSAVSDQTQYLGFSDLQSGYAAKQQIKSSIAPYNVLDNVIDFAITMDGTTKAKHIVARLWCPSVTLAAGGAAVEGAGYANLAKGSTILCANGIAYKDGDTGTDTWTAIIAS